MVNFFLNFIYKKRKLKIKNPFRQCVVYNFILAVSLLCDALLQWERNCISGDRSHAYPSK